MSSEWEEKQTVEVDVCPVCKSDDFKENHLSNRRGVYYVRKCRRCGAEFDKPHIQTRGRGKDDEA